jgi:hypothetical protein
MAGLTPPPLKEVCKTSRGGRVRRHITLFGKDFAPLPSGDREGPTMIRCTVNAAFAQKILVETSRFQSSATPYIG